MPQSTPIPIIQGDTPTVNFTFTNPLTNSAVDITGFTLYFTAKLNETDTQAQALIAVTWNPVTGGGYDTTKGQTFYTFTAAQTNIPVESYRWDIKMVSATSAITHTYQGILTIYQPITTT